MKRGLMLLPLIVAVVVLLAQPPRENLGASDLGAAFKSSSRAAKSTGPVAFRGFFEGDLKEPLGVATDGNNGSVFVADTGNAVVKRFGPAGSLEAVIGHRGEDSANPKKGDLFYPVGITVGPEGAIYVSDLLSNRVSVFSSTGQFLSYFGEKEDGPRPFKTPVGIYYEDGNFYLNDVQQSKVFVMDRQGTVVRELGSGYGFEPGRMAYASYTCVDHEGNIWVSDSNNSRVQVFKPSGDLVTVIPIFSAAGAVSLPRGIHHDSAGRFHVVNALAHQIQVFEATGKFLFSYGESGKLPGQFGFPNGIAVSGSLVYVTDRANNRVQMWEVTK